MCSAMLSLLGCTGCNCSTITPALGISSTWSPRGAGYLLQGCGSRDSSQPPWSTAARDSCGQRDTGCFERGTQLIPPKRTRQHPKLGQPTRATLSSAEPQGSAVCITGSRAAKEGSQVCAAPPRMSHCSSLQPSMVQLLGGGCTISTPPPVPSFFPPSIQHFKHTQNQVLGTHIKS